MGVAGGGHPHPHAGRPALDGDAILIGKSGHFAVHLVPEEPGEFRIMLEHMQNGEIIDFPDLATARECYHLIGGAIRHGEVDLILRRRGY